MIEFLERASLHFIIYISKQGVVLVSTINTFTCTVITGWGSGVVLQGERPLIYPRTRPSQLSLTQVKVARTAFIRCLLYEAGRLAV